MILKLYLDPAPGMAGPTVVLSSGAKPFAHPHNSKI
jgi:hypothetical protein